MVKKGQGRGCVWGGRKKENFRCFHCLKGKTQRCVGFIEFKFLLVNSVLCNYYSVW